MSQQKGDSGGAAWVVYNQFMSAVGALSLLSVFKDAIELKQALRTFLTAWQEVVHPIASFAFQWIPAIWNWLGITIPLPNWYPEYATVGFVVSTAIARGIVDAGQRIARYNAVTLRLRELVAPEIPFSSVFGVPTATPAPPDRTEWRRLEEARRTIMNGDQGSEHLNNDSRFGEFLDARDRLYASVTEFSWEGTPTESDPYPASGTKYSANEAELLTLLDRYYPLRRWPSLWLISATAVFFLVWPATWAYIFAEIARHIGRPLTLLDLRRYVLTSLQFLVYFSAFIGVNYILFFVP